MVKKNNQRLKSSDGNYQQVVNRVWTIHWCKQTLQIETKVTPLQGLRIAIFLGLMSRSYKTKDGYIKNYNFGLARYNHNFCKVCEKPIEFKKNENDKWHPVDIGEDSHDCRLPITKDELNIKVYDS